MRDAPGSTVLDLEGVGFGYQQDWALRGISLRVNPGELVGVLGPNGSGKSTLLKLADGMLSPQEGEVRIKGSPIRTYSRPRLAREVAMVSQESYFHFAFSSLEVVLMGRFAHRRGLQFESRRDLEVAREAMRATRCLDLAERSILELSGGEKQRVLIARALAQEPSLILLDEPTAFLDLRFKREVFQLIAGLTRSSPLSCLVVTHDLDLAAQFCQRIILLKDGEPFASGSPGDVITAANIENVFGCPVVVDAHPVAGSPRVSISG